MFLGLVASSTVVERVNIPQAGRWFILWALAAVALSLQRVGIQGGPLSFNFAIPSSWVRGASAARSGLIWGISLGGGVVTQAPFAVFHVALMAAVLFGDTDELALGVTSFAVGRLIGSATPDQNGPLAALFISRRKISSCAAIGFLVVLSISEL